MAFQRSLHNCPFQVELPDLVESMDAVMDWEEQVGRVCPAVSARHGEKPTDLVAACPIDPDEPSLTVLLETLSLAAFMRRAQALKQSQEPCGPSSSALHELDGEYIMTKEDMLWPLLSPEFAPCTQGSGPNLHAWCRSPKSHFGGLLEEIYQHQHDVTGHAVCPLLIPTFSAPNHTLDIEAVPSVPDDLKIFSQIHMDTIACQANLRESMKEHLGRITDQVSKKHGRAFSALCVHVNMKQDFAQDIVDYLRFQIEWLARELVFFLKDLPDTDVQTVHVLALVVHGVRGSDEDRSMRPFLFAGPCLGECRRTGVTTFPWSGVAVDHFSHLLPWGMRPEELSGGSIKDIFGLEETQTDRFCLILADALPHIVPRFGHEHPHADSFTIVQTLLQQIRCKPALVRCIRAVLAEQLSLEQAPQKLVVVSVFDKSKKKCTLISGVPCNMCSLAVTVKRLET